MNLTLDTLSEFHSGYNPLNDTERFRHIFDYVHSIYSLDDTAFPIGLLLIASVSEGTDPKTLARFCGMTLGFVTEVANRLTASGIWLDDGSVDYEFLTAESDLWDFWFVTSTLVAQGRLAWTGEREGNVRVYYRVTPPTANGKKSEGKRKK
jgi:hypothetical protein